MLQTGILEYDIEEYENAFLMEEANYNDAIFKCRMPKLMPFIKSTKPLEIVKSYNSNIIANNSASKPHVLPTIKTANYMEIRRASYADLSSLGSWSGEYYMGGLEVGVKFLCLVVNKNIRNIFITDVMGDE